jgi:hypothetical protein
MMYAIVRARGDSIPGYGQSRSDSAGQQVVMHVHNLQVPIRDDYLLANVESVRISAVKKAALIRGLAVAFLTLLGSTRRDRVTVTVLAATAKCPI